MRAAISILAFTQLLSPMFALLPGFNALQESTKPQAFASVPQREEIGRDELTITCAYTAGSSLSGDRRTAPRVILDRAVISFTPSNESHMRIELTFTNDSGNKIADQRTVYLAIDDERGENHLRRALHDVDFTKLESGRPTKFSETLLAPAFSSGLYVVSIWIPSTDPSLKFDPAHNFLLSSNGVPDPITGLNQIAKFTVAASGRHNSAAEPD